MPLERRAQRTVADDHEARGGVVGQNERERVEQDVDPLLADRAADEPDHRRLASEPERPPCVRAGGGRQGRRVDAVRHGAHLRWVGASDLDDEARDRGRDRDHAVAAAQRKAVEPTHRGAAAERVGVVPRRHEMCNASPPGGRRAVKVGVDEVGVDELRPQAAQLAGELQHGERVERRTDRHPPVGDADRRQGSAEAPRGAVRAQDENVHVPAARGEPRQEPEQVALGARDAAHLANVHDPRGGHRVAPAAGPRRTASIRRTSAFIRCA